jgi:hypothetical protein
VGGREGGREGEEEGREGKGGCMHPSIGGGGDRRRWVPILRRTTFQLSIKLNEIQATNQAS